MSKQTNWSGGLIDDIQQTENFEIHCDQVGILMARCAYALLTDDQSHKQYPEMWHHFHFCTSCAEEYQMAMELARRESSQPLSTPGRIPARPDAGKAVVWSRASNAVLAVFPGFLAALGAGLTRGDAEVALDLAEPIEVTLGEGPELRIEFDLASHEQDGKLRDLYCIVWTDADDLRNNLEAAPVWLQIDDEGPAIRHAALDDLGEVAFFGIAPGAYSLRLHLTGREYAVTGIRIP